MAGPKIYFPGSQGHKLAGRLDMPEGDVRAYALFAHCFTCTKDIYAVSRITRVLNARGLAVLRFDFTGLGASEGDFANTNFSSNVDDLVAAAEHMKAQGQAPSLIIGHSLGGAAILAGSGQIASAKAVVTLGAPADISDIAYNFADQIAKIMTDGEAEVQLAGRPFTIKRQFIEDVRTTRLEEHVRELDKALLVMHAPLDATVGIDNAAKIFAWAKHRKSYVSLDTADHLLSHKTDAEYAGNVIACWADRYLEADETKQISALSDKA